VLNAPIFMTLPPLGGIIPYTCTHTLAKNLKTKVYWSCLHLYGVQPSHSYIMWDFTLYLYSNNFSLKCVSLPHDSLSLEWKSLSSMSISWWSLESTCSKYLHHCSAHRIRHLNPPPEKLSIQEILKPRIHCRHLIIRISHQVKPSNLILIVGKSKEVNIGETYINGP